MPDSDEIRNMTNLELLHVLDLFLCELKRRLGGYRHA